MNDIGTEIAKILDDYSDKAARVIEQAERTAAQTAVRELKAKAPRDRGKTGYDRSFATKKTGSGRATEYTVYSKVPGMTHLLENGHRIRGRDKRIHGTSRSYVHILPASEFTDELIASEIYKEVRKLDS